MTETDIPEKIASLSHAPGVYLMKNARDEIIYVGKAKDLKKRVSSYFQRSETPDMKTHVLVRQITDFSVIITTSENEALVLESNLIKRHRPRYNVILKDDKRYPLLRIDEKADYPNITVVRKPAKDRARYFGPYTSPSAVHKTLKFIHKTFRLRKCGDRAFRHRERPCLQYQMDACLGPCCFDVDREVYAEIVKEVILFLQGKTPDLIEKLRKEMTEAADRLDFEKASELRDRMLAIRRTLEKQTAVSTDFKDRDVIGLAEYEGKMLITLLQVRGGYLNGSRHFHLPETLASPPEAAEAFIRQYYEKNRNMPHLILTPCSLENREWLEKHLRELRNTALRIVRPRRGEKKRLIEMAAANAEAELRRIHSTAQARMDLLARLQKRMNLHRLPRRIECFDNSNISGTSPVSAMVVFEDGVPAKSHYRRYQIRTVEEQDDYAYMAEALERRYGKGEASEPLPDLLLVDGGKGQMNIALAILEGLGMDGSFAVAGIAKKDERRGETADKIFQPGRANPVIFGNDGDLLLFLQRIRDEAHRFVITFHRKKRGKKTLGSAMDSIPGVGKQRKKELLKHFGSIKKIREATPEELAALPGISIRLAESIRQSMNGNSGESG